MCQVLCPGLRNQNFLVVQCFLKNNIFRIYVKWRISGCIPDIFRLGSGYALKSSFCPIVQLFPLLWISKYSLFRLVIFKWFVLLHIFMAINTTTERLQEIAKNKNRYSSDEARLWQKKCMKILDKAKYSSTKRCNWEKKTAFILYIVGDIYYSIEYRET